MDQLFGLQHRRTDPVIMQHVFAKFYHLTHKNNSSYNPIKM